MLLPPPPQAQELRTAHLRRAVYLILEDSPFSQKKVPRFLSHQIFSQLIAIF